MILLKCTYISPISYSTTRLHLFTKTLCRSLSNPTKWNNCSGFLLKLFKIYHSCNSGVNAPALQKILILCNTQTLISFSSMRCTETIFTNIISGSLPLTTTTFSAKQAVHQIEKNCCFSFQMS